MGTAGTTELNKELAASGMTATGDVAASRDFPDGGPPEDAFAAVLKKNGGDAADRGHVVRFFDAFSHLPNATVSLMVEYMDGGSLQALVDDGGLADEALLGSLCAQASRGLRFLHATRHVHRRTPPPPRRRRRQQRAHRRRARRELGATRRERRRGTKRRDRVGPLTPPG